MSRTRTLKPDNWEDEHVGAVSRDARLLRDVLITYADDDGRWRHLLPAVRGHGYPWDEDVTDDLVGRWADELNAEGLIVLYRAKGSTYGCFPKWHVHQYIQRRRPSILPACDDIRVVTYEQARARGRSLQEPLRLASDTCTGSLREGDEPRAQARGPFSFLSFNESSTTTEPSPLSELVNEKTLKDQRNAPETRALFDHWRQQCGHPTAKPTQDRLRKIAARLREGYTSEDIRQAIDGAARAAFVSESTGKRYDDIELICRSGSKLESFIGRVSSPAQESTAEYLSRVNRGVA